MLSSSKYYYPRCTQNKMNRVYRDPHTQLATGFESNKNGRVCTHAHLHTRTKYSDTHSRTQTLSKYISLFVFEKSNASFLSSSPLLLLLFILSFFCDRVLTDQFRTKYFFFSFFQWVHTIQAIEKEFFLRCRWDFSRTYARSARKS